jgi:hypothetical protein
MIVVNTCGFIDSAVEESLEAIGEALNENGKVIVTGCLGARGDMVKEAHPAVLAVTGPHALEEVMQAVHHYLPKPHDPFVDLVPPQGIRLTPKHYAYLKISEGCNHRCTFCIIPSLRGDLVSRPIGEVMQEAEALVKAGVIHAQSSAYPGGDFRPNAPISRAQAAAWAGRVLEQRGASLADLGSLHPVTVLDAATQDALDHGPVAYDAMHWASVALPGKAQPVTFSDLPVSTPGYTSIVEAAKYGVIDGFPGGTFQPQGTLTRAQAAKMGAILANEITSGAPTTLQLQAVAQHVDDALTAAMKSLPAGAVTASQVSSALQSAGMSQYAAPAALAGPDGTVASVVGMKAHHPHLGALQVQIDRCRPVFLGSTVAEIDCSTSGTATRANGTLYHPIPIQQGLWLYFVRSGSTWRETDLQFTGTTLPTWATTSK